MPCSSGVPPQWIYLICFLIATPCVWDLPSPCLCPFYQSRHGIFISCYRNSVWLVFRWSSVMVLYFSSNFDCGRRWSQSLPIPSWLEIYFLMISWSVSFTILGCSVQLKSYFISPYNFENFTLNLFSNQLQLTCYLLTQKGKERPSWCCSSWRTRGRNLWTGVRAWDLGPGWPDPMSPFKQLWMRSERQGTHWE